MIFKSFFYVDMKQDSILGISSALKFTLSISLANTCHGCKTVPFSLQQKQHYSKGMQPEFMKITTYVYISTHSSTHSFIHLTNELPVLHQAPY